MTPRNLHALAISAMLIALLPACTSPRELAAPDPTPTVELTIEAQEWDLVFISDSSGWGVGERYAAYIEEDVGVPVTVHDMAVGGLAARSVLKALRGETAPGSLRGLADLIRDAEVVVFYANPEASVSEVHPGDWQCVDPGAGLYVEDCSVETFEVYRADLDAIYEEFFALRGGAPTIVRAFDGYAPLHSVWRAQDVYDACLGCWKTYNQVIHEAAAAHHVPVAAVFEHFNGPDHDEDPRDKGYIGGDGMHTSDAGRDAIAGLLRGLGYDVTIP